MSAKPIRPVTLEDVSVACEEIVKTGEHPSIIKVHQVIGRGSYSTIKKHIDQWIQSDQGKEAHAAQLPAVVELPEGYFQEAEYFLKKVYQLAENESISKIEKIRAERDQAVAVAEEQAKQAIDYADEISSEKAVLERRLDEDQQKLTAQNEIINRLNAKVYSLEEDKSKAEKSMNKAVEQISVLKKTVTDLEQEVVLVKQSHDISLRAHEDTKAELSEAKHKHNSNLSSLKEEHKNILKQLREEHKESTSVLVASYESAAKVLSETVQDAQKQRDELSLKVDSLLGQLDKSKNEVLEQWKLTEELDRKLKASTIKPPIR